MPRPAFSSPASCTPVSRRLSASGRYEDHVVFDDGAARFAEKVVILDSRLIDTLLAIPL